MKEQTDVKILTGSWITNVKSQELVLSCRIHFFSSYLLFGWWFDLCDIRHNGPQTLRVQSDLVGRLAAGHVDLDRALEQLVEAEGHLELDLVGIWDYVSGKTL